MNSPKKAAESTFYVSLGVHFWGNLVSGFPGFWKFLGGIESFVLQDELKTLSIDRPIYITGLARAGTTLLLEFIASQKDVVTHRYCDFPFLHIPYYWNLTNTLQSVQQSEPVERAHGDRMFVTRASPEAMEEVLWMSFFPRLHDPSVSNVLDSSHRNEKFNEFYKNHIKKLLLSRGGSRYAAKGNYNVSRCQYILNIFPDARFVIPIREPLSHIESLIRQHRRFCEIGQSYPRVRSYMSNVGHFEFGLDRKPLNLGDTRAIKEIQNLWNTGNDILAWSRYWVQVHSYLLDVLESSPAFNDAAFLLSYEKLCTHPVKVLSALMRHVGLEENEAELDAWSAKISPRSYYSGELSDEQKEVVRKETASIQRRMNAFIQKCL